MEVAQSSKSTKRIKRDLIVATWMRLRRSRVGRGELRQIQEALDRQLGPMSVESPAAIARVLADEGAELRHPEVVEYDAEWREQKIEDEFQPFAAFEELLSEEPLSLERAAELLRKLVEMRKSHEREARELAVEARRNLNSLVNDARRSEAERAAQAEIVEWLKVWMQAPVLFADWLDLRQRSAEFRERFMRSDSKDKRAQK